MAAEHAACASSIEVHPNYPFVRIGLAFDFQPWLSEKGAPEHCLKPTDWWIEIAGEVQSWVYETRTDVLAQVEPVLFAPWRREVVQQQIEAAIATGNIPLALRLAEGRGHAMGRTEAHAEFAAALAKADTCLKQFKRPVKRASSY